MPRIRILLCLLAASNIFYRISCFTITNNYIHIHRPSSRRLFSVICSTRSSPSTCLLAQQQQDDSSSNSGSNNDFWSQQKQLMMEMTQTADDSLSQETQDKYEQQLSTLISDTVFIGFFIFCALWSEFENPLVSLSYVFGASLGAAYAYGLGKYVGMVGGVATEADAVKGAGVGQARFAFLIILFIFVGKFRSSGLMEVPAILGFFTYQLGSLVQALRSPDE